MPVNSHFGRWGKRIILDFTAVLSLRYIAWAVSKRYLIRSSFDSPSWEAGAKLSFQSIWDICQSPFLCTVGLASINPFHFSLSLVYLHQEVAVSFTTQTNNKQFLITGPLPINTFPSICAVWLRKYLSFLLALCLRVLSKLNI